MNNQHLERQKRMEALWREHEANAITDDEGTYVRLKGVNLSDHGLDTQDPRTPGNMTLSSTSDTQHENYFLRKYDSGDVRLFRNRNYKRNI